MHLFLPVRFRYWEVVDTMYRVSVTVSQTTVISPMSVDVVLGYADDDNFLHVGLQGFLVLFQSTSDTIVAGMLLSLIYLKLIQLLQPFTDPGLNRIKETSIWQIFFVFLIALLLHTNSIDSDFLTVCLFVAFFINFILLLGQALVQYWVRHVHVRRGSKSQSGRMTQDGEREMEMEMERRTTLSATATATVPGAALTSNVSPQRSKDARTSSSILDDVGGARTSSSCCSSSTREDNMESEGKNESNEHKDSNAPVAQVQIYSPFHHVT